MKREAEKILRAVVRAMTGERGLPRFVVVEMINAVLAIDGASPRAVATSTAPTVHRRRAVATSTAPTVGRPDPRTRNGRRVTGRVYTRRHA